mgnify:CR=1 FL=1
MRKKLTKEQIKDLNNDFWIYTMLLSTLVILIESLKTYLITIKDTPITLAIFLVPIMYFIANYITKKFGSQRLIFGSNLPVSDPGAAIAKVACADISYEDKIKIAHGNLEKLIEGVK